MAVTRRTVAAVLFLESVNASLQAYGSVNSSPWTAESFGGDPDKLRSLREYVGHAVILSMGSGAIAGYVGQSWVPVLGAVGINLYLVWLYTRAAGRAIHRGSEDWS